MSDSRLNSQVDYRCIFEDAPDAYLVLALNPPTFTIQAAGDAYLEATGQQRDDLTSTRGFESCPEDSLTPDATATDEVRQSFVEIVEYERPTALGAVRYDVPINGSEDAFAEKYWSPRNVPIFNEDGELIHILHRVDEVTDFILQDRFRSRTPPEAAHVDKRLLVVKPDDKRGTYLQGLFSAHWQVCSVPDAASARPYLDDHRVDAVLLADELSDTSGLELTRELKDRVGTQVPIILRLHNRTVANYREAYEAGADDVIGNSPDAREYVSRIQAQLSGAELRHTLQERSRQQYRRLFQQAPVGMLREMPAGRGTHLIATWQNPRSPTNWRRCSRNAVATDSRRPGDPDLRLSLAPIH